MSKSFYQRFSFLLFIAFSTIGGIPAPFLVAKNVTKNVKNPENYFSRVLSIYEYKLLDKTFTLLNEEIKGAETANKLIGELRKIDFANTFMCQIQTQLSQTACVANGGGSYTANFEVIIGWEAAPVAENINITIGASNIGTIDLSTAISPDTLSFSLDADGIGQDTLIAFFETTTTCADTFVIKSPAPCPPSSSGCTRTGNLSLGLPTFAKEAPNGTIINASPINLVEDNGGNNQTIGLHYTGVNIPSGATITSATIQFEANSSDNVNAVAITIEGEAEDNADLFSTTAFDVTTRSPTLNSVNWTPLDWVENEMGANQLTPDLSNILQEIINRSGWNANQNIVFLFTGMGQRNAFPEAILNVSYQYVGDCEANDACTSISSSEIAGTAWNDYNYDGILNESNLSGIQGIQVALYDCTSTLIATTYTNASGNYEFTGLSSQRYRVEFSLPESVACWAKPTHTGIDNGTMIQLVYPGNCASLGLANPASYCEENPLIGMTCFSEGVYNGATANDPAIISLPYDAEGHDFSGTTKLPAYQGTILDEIDGIGAAYGLAWQATRQRMYLGAYHKRYSGFGPAGPDAIYQYDLVGNKTGTIELDALLGSTNTAGADVHDFTTMVGLEIMDLGVGDASFDGVGKRSFGDLEMSGDMTTLYAVNLFDRKIYAIDVADGIATNASIVNSWDTPDPIGMGTHRPFALKYHEGKLWVGIVTEDAANAYVYSLDIAQHNFNLELTIPLGYDRQSVVGNDANAATVAGDWRAWASDADATTYLVDMVGSPDDIAFPQPMLTDIEFDGTGMILGFRDRFGDQAGSEAFFNNTDATATDYTWSATAGDILRACYNGYSYVLESGNSGDCTGVSGLDDSGPGGAEYYHWDYYYFNPDWNPLNRTEGFHWETTQGALLQLPNDPYVITTAMDPYSDYSGGILRLNNETGRREGILANDKSTFGNLSGGYTIYETGEFGASPPSNTNGTFGKANGLGDLEAFCQAAPVEIGNYVWCDSIQNGIQDACESGIDSLIIRVYDSNNRLVGQDTTINGYYYFNQHNIDTAGITVDVNGIAMPTTGWSGLAYSEAYHIVFGFGQYDMASGRFTVGTTVYQGFTTANVNGNANDNIDSDVAAANYSIASNLFPVINMTTAPIGYGDHKFDLGLICGDYDYGDLPDIANGTTGVTDYETYDSTGGPSHQIIAGLFLGDTVDIDTDGFPNAQALGDDTDNVDDEDGVSIFSSLDIIPGGSIRLPLSVTNTTGDTAYVEAWIDWNGDGDFDEPNEMVADLKDNEDGVFPDFLTINVPIDAIKGVQVGFRIRLSNEDNMTPYGRVASGEIEDYLLGIDCPQNNCLPIEIDIKKE